MTSTAKKILDQALALPEDDRRRIGEALLDSVPDGATDDGDLDAEWKSEVADRIGEVERGEVKLIPGSEVAARIKEMLRRE